MFVERIASLSIGRNVSNDQGNPSAPKRQIIGAEALEKKKDKNMSDKKRENLCWVQKRNDSFVVQCCMNPCQISQSPLGKPYPRQMNSCRIGELNRQGCNNVVFDMNKGI